MLAENVQNPPMTEAHHRATFFRQSGWLMIANIAGGALMWSVHLLNKFIPGGEYGHFVALLTVAMLLPTIPLQMILAQQTAKALAVHRERELSGIIRMFLLLTALVWLIGSVVVLVLQRTILEHWQMNSPLGLWVTLVVALGSLWMPIFAGVLQGQQNFLWLGWTMMSTAIGRVTIAAFAVLALRTGATGMMAGVLVGVLAAIVIGAWQSRSLWLARPLPFDWRSLLSQVGPLMLAFFGFQILFTADSLFVQTYFSKTQMDCYGSAGTLSRALIWLVLPLATVMFPRMVHSAAKSEKSNLIGLVLLVTAILAVVGALGVSLLGPWVVRLAYDEDYAAIACPLLPWYSSAMIPFALSNVLLNDLLARPASKLVLALCVFGLALAYLVAVTRFHTHLVNVLQTMGVCSLALLAICGWFTWRSKAQRLESVQ
jgi:O-antigen/teichoic acid export membrane protein